MDKSSDLHISATEANRNVERLKIWRAKMVGRYVPKFTGPVYIRSRWNGWLVTALILMLGAIPIVLAPPTERVVSQTENVTITQRVSK